MRFTSRGVSDLLWAYDKLGVSSELQGLQRDQKKKRQKQSERGGSLEVRPPSGRGSEEAT